jgi:predicted transcriptional regulator
MITLEEKRRTIVSAQVEADTRAALERLAREGDRSLSAQVRRALAEHLARANDETEGTQQ